MKKDRCSCGSVGSRVGFLVVFYVSALLLLDRADTFFIWPPMEP
jgi:hypothetical protein